MKSLRRLALIIGFLAAANAVNAKITTVNTTNNISPGVGETNLVQAMNLLADGDTIRFNIPGAGPFYLVTPPLTPNNGYPLITVNNVTIDGYSQPGSSPNSNTILASNNAVIKIILDSRAGGASSYNVPGEYDSTESAVLYIAGATNVHIRGLAFLGPGKGSETAADPNRYAFAIASSLPGGAVTNEATDIQISGCWISLDPGDRTSVYRFLKPVTAYRGYTSTMFPRRVTVGVAKGTATDADARAQQNIIMAGYIPVVIEGPGTRVSGNRFNVYPSGNKDYNINGTEPYDIEAFIEIGRDASNLVIGTDGDGSTDAEERNLFGGLTAAGDDQILEWYGGSQTNMIIAGNYFGMGADGVTRFTNSMKIFGGFDSTTTVRVGSDFDGVSDAVEGNVISMNYPFDALYPTPAVAGGQLPIFASLSTGARVSLRGNTLINNNIPPFSYANGSSPSYPPTLTDYFAAYIDTTATNGIFPTLSTNSTQRNLIGSCGLGLAPYTNILIDVYLADPEAWTNGQAFMMQELLDPNTGAFGGFPEGRTYVGSFVDNGPLDRDLRPGQFDFDLSAFNLGLAFVTVAANYSADPPGTHNGRVQTSEFAVPVTAPYIPGGIDSVGLSRVVSDTPLLVPAATALGNWEPYSSVLGNSTFLIEGNTFATNDLTNQRFVVYFQPADGSTGRLGECSFSDDGKPYRDAINLSRQNGNPGRVAGDKRPGAVTFISATETSVGQLVPFQTVNRWGNNVMYQANDRYVTEQLFTLNPLTLVQTPVTNAWDYVFGPFVASAFGTGADTTQNSRTGGRPEFLDNGNIVVVIDDKTAFLPGSSGESTTFSIIKPDGTIVKGPTLVDPRAIWDNVAAYQGGFAVKVENLLYFYDNAGNLKGQIDITTSGRAFNTDRGDSTRIAAHINSPYVYLCGSPPNTHLVSLAVFDSRNQSVVTVYDVSEPSFVASTDRATVASDALDRIVCAWESAPSGYVQQQTAARVLKFDAASKTISPLTKSFWAFQNVGQTNYIRSYRMTVSMTTKQICVAAKGEINLQNRPDLGTNSPVEMNFFTVFTHPTPADDPTTPVGGLGPKLTITRAGNQATLAWPTSAAGFTLESKNTLADATWTTVGTNNPTTVTIGAGNKFYRLRK